MASLNRVMIMGNLGADPELRHTQSGQAVTTLSVATTHVHNDREGKPQETTEWHRIVVWGRTAENCAQYLRKGRAVMAEGRLATRSWEDGNGEKKYVTEIIASNVQFLSAPSHTQTAATAVDATAEANAPRDQARETPRDAAPAPQGATREPSRAKPQPAPVRSTPRPAMRPAATPRFERAVGGELESIPF